MIRLIIFDMDNVIENNEFFRKNVVRICVSTAVKSAIFRNKRNAITEVKKLHNFFVKNFGEFPYEYHLLFWKDLIIKGCGNFSLKKLNEVYNEFINEYLRNVKPYSDVIPVLSKLKGKYRLGIIANGNTYRCYRFLEHYHIYDFFDIIVTSNEAGFKKPEPFLFKYVLEKVNCKPHEALMIGDRCDVDVKGAKALGIYTVRIKRGRYENQAPLNKDEIPDFEIRTLYELLNLPIIRSK